MDNGHIDKPQVFVSYAREDLARVSILVDDLLSRGVNVWLDQRNLKPGRWRPQIEKAIARSRYFVLCLSAATLRKTGDAPGFTDTELNLAFSIAVTQDERSFAVVPVRLEDCGRGDHRISMWQQFDLFPDWAGKVDILAVHLGGTALDAINGRDDARRVMSPSSALASLAIAHLYAGDNLAAEKALRQVVSIDPTNAAAWNNLSVALGQMGRHSDAIAAADNALTHRPSYADAIYNRGVALESLGREDEALECYIRAAALNPSDVWAAQNTGISLGRKGREVEALNVFNDLYQRGDRSQKTLYNRGVTLGRLCRYPEAYAAFLEVLAHFPSDTEALYALGNLYEMTGRPIEAASAYRRLLTVDDRHVSARDRLSIVNRPHKQS